MMKYYYVIDIYERARIGDLLFVNSYDGTVTCNGSEFMETINKKKGECITLSCNGVSSSTTTAKVSILERLA